MKSKRSARPRPCAWPWPTRCGAVGRGPLAHVGMPVCLDPLLAHRKIAQPKPGPALYALRALAVALAENSAPAGRLVGSKIVHPSSIDIGFAVEAEDGVLVPVIRNADKKSLKDLIARYNELVELARAAQTAADATGGSIATVTNFGTFGLNGPRRFRCRNRRSCWAWARRGTMPHWDERQGPVRAGHGGQPDLELRPSRAGRRRGGPFAPARRRIDVQAGNAVNSSANLIRDNSRNSRINYFPFQTPPRLAGGRSRRPNSELPE